MTVSNAAVPCLDKDARIAELEAALAARDTLIDTLRVQLAQLRRMTFGQSSEKLSLQIEQLELTLEDLEGEAAISDSRTVEPHPAERAELAAKFDVAEMPNGKICDKNEIASKLKDNKFDGKGTMIFANGAKYIGNWKENKSDGLGTFYTPNGDKFVVGWKDDKVKKQRFITYAKDSKYPGKFKLGNDKFNGQGIRIYENGIIYTGKFKESKLDGQGTIIYPNGNSFSGFFKDNNFNGQGTFINIERGDKHIGEWKDSKMNGQGTMIYANGEKYSGEWKNGSRAGQGTYTWPNGDKYIGSFLNFKQNGQGTMTYANGEKFVGEWKNHKEFNGILYKNNGEQKSSYREGVLID